MATGDLNDQALTKRLAETVYGTKDKPGLETDVASVKRVIFGVPAEGFEGLVQKVDRFVKRVGEMDDGRKFIITLATIAASSLPGIAALIGQIIQYRPPGGTLP